MWNVGDLSEIFFIEKWKKQMRLFEIRILFNSFICHSLQYYLLTSIRDCSELTVGVQSLLFRFPKSLIFYVIASHCIYCTFKLHL